MGDMGRAQAGELRTAVFAGGCFWCMQPPFDNTPGVVSTLVGYTGGARPDPTYEQVSSGATGHLEAIEVTYDPARVSYAQLCEVFWRSVDPTDGGGQFADQGPQYTTAIFYGSGDERATAEASKKALAASGKFARPIVTAILARKPFYRAEEYHQHYYLKNVLHYNAYKQGSGRAGFLQRTWGH